MGIKFRGVYGIVTRSSLHTVVIEFFLKGARLSGQVGILKCLQSQGEKGHIQLISHVYQRISMELHFDEIAKRLNIATSTAHRIYQQFQRIGNVEPIRIKSRPKLRALDEQDTLLFIIQRQICMVR